MLYIYSSVRSPGAFDLVKTLSAQRLRKFDGIDFWDKRARRSLQPGDVVVCWGETLPEFDGIRILNALDIPLTPWKAYEKLSNSSVPIAGISRIKLGQFSPLLEAIHTPDGSYYNRNEKFVTEFRIHSFDKRSIRAGVKVVRDGYLPCTESDFKPGYSVYHPWIRTFSTGWRVNYDGFKSTLELRRLAHKAVSVLGLTFGAVDIGQTVEGRLKVISVDRAPRLEGITIQSYTRAIARWIKEDKDVTGGVRAGTDEETSPSDDL